MKSITNIVLTIFAIAFWVFRVIVVVCATLHIEFPVETINSAIEIPILFITIMCIVLIYKKSFIGGIIYFAMYAGYFGMDIYTKLSNSSINTEAMILNIAIDIIGIVISLFNFIYVIYASNKKTAVSTKKTDWFFQNKKFDRELDERADKNNYRIS